MLLYLDIHTEICFETQTVVINGNLQQVRPKTFQVLKMLIEANGELVSKESLLTTIWDDVVVDEQVIFQSIKELRKLFPGLAVIKTQPRKGYAWIPTPSTPTSNNQIASHQGKKRYTLTGGVISLLLVCVILITFWLKPIPSTFSGSVVVLPVQSDMVMNDHDWVRYGIMDQVISRLLSTKNAGVLQTDYVLEVINRAEVSAEDISQGHIQSIFEVSGAELIVFMRLSGNPNDYQIIYTLYKKDGIEKGVVFDKSVQDAADKIARIVGTKIMPEFRVSQSEYVSSFANQLIAEALELKYNGDNSDAISMLEAAKIAEPKNLVATRLLIQTLVENGASHTKINAIAVPALAIARQNSETVDFIRIGFWLAVSTTLNGSDTEGMALLDEVEAKATSINDWLYLAYIEEIRGKFNQSQHRFSLANADFLKALEYHSILHCPLGESNTLINLSKLADTQGNKTLAVEYAKEAVDLIQSRGLYKKLPKAQKWLKTLNSL